MIHGFLDPWEPLFMDLNIPKYFQKYKKILNRFRTTIILINLKIMETFLLDIFGKDRHRNDEDPFTKS